MLNSTESMEDDRTVANCYIVLGDVSKEKGEYDESLRYHWKSLEIFERIADALSVADCYMNIAAVYKARGELKQAMCAYEKGLALYEDFIVEDGSKSADSGLDVSLNSSCFSDRQHIRTVSKSDEHLSQTTLIDFLDKNAQQTSNDVISKEKFTSDSFLILEKNSFLQPSKSMNDPSLFLSENMIHGVSKSIPPLQTFDIQCIDHNNILSCSVPVFKTHNEQNAGENHLRRRYMTCETSATPIDQDLLVFDSDIPLLNGKSIEVSNYTEPTNIHKPITSNKGSWQQLLNKQFMIIIAIILFSALIFWFLQNSSMKFLLSCTPNRSAMHQNSRVYQSDDLGEQLRKILPWRKDYIKSLDKNKRRTIETFFTSSKNRTKMTVEKFQHILNMLDLRIVLTQK